MHRSNVDDFKQSFVSDRDARSPQMESVCARDRGQKLRLNKRQFLGTAKLSSSVWLWVFSALQRQFLNHSPFAIP